MNRVQKISLALMAALLSLGPAFPVRAQDGKPLRVEIEARALVDDYYAIPAGENGLLLLFDDEDTGDRDDWTLYNYDRNLTQRWTRRMSFDRPYHHLGDDREGDKVYSLFVSRFGSGSEARILCADFQTDSLGQTDITLPSHMEPQYFFVDQGQAFILGYAAPKRKLGLLFGGTRYLPLIYKVDVASGEIHDMTPADRDHHEIVSASLSAHSGNLNVLLSDRKQRKPTRLELQVYSPAGSLLSSTIVNAGKGYLFEDAKVIQASDHDIIVLGSYRGDARSTEYYAEGLFMALLSDFEQQFIKFYPFTDFDTFGKTVSSRTVRKVAKRKSKGKEVSVGFRMLIHDEIDIIDGNFVIQAEAYHPEYRTEYRYDPFYGYGQTVQVFEGWRFDHALLAAFSRDGERLWDQTMQMHNILEQTSVVREHVLLLQDGEDLIMVYSYGGNLFSIVVNHGELVEGREKTNIETGNRGDKVRANYRSDLEFWYDRYILAWGFQKIKTSGQRREVFFMNKIVYR